MEESILINGDGAWDYGSVYNLLWGHCDELAPWLTQKLIFGVKAAQTKTTFTNVSFGMKVSIYYYKLG